MDDFEIRTYKEGDEQAILRMFNFVFHQNRGLAHWYWKYRDHPWGRGAMSLAFAGDGTLAAHFGGYPIRLHLSLPHEQRRIMPSMLLGDKMSHPAFRHAGLRKKGVLARTFFHFRDMYGHDLPFGIGFATGHSLRLGRLLFGYMDVEEVPYKVLQLSDFTFSRWLVLRARFRGIRVVEVKDVDENWTELFHRLSSYYLCLTVRDATYLRWRYVHRPDKEYMILALCHGSDLVGWGVFSREEDGLKWVDALLDPAYTHYTCLLIDAARKQMSAHSSEYMTCWFPERPEWWGDTLHHLGFIRQPEPNAIHLSGPEFSFAQGEDMLRRFFYYTMGDSDLY